MVIGIKLLLMRTFLRAPAGEHPEAMQQGSGTKDLFSLFHVVLLAIATTIFNTLYPTHGR